METNRVVVQTDLLAFSSEISNLVAEGWKLIGGVSITEDKTADNSGQNNNDLKFIYTQKLYKAS